MYLDTKYRDKNYSPPRHDIDPDKKGEEWHRDFCEYIYSSELIGNSVSFCDSRAKMKENRDFSNGDQDKEQYMDILLGKIPKGETQRKGYMNINWNIFSIAPKFKAVAVSMYEEYDYDITANAIDEKSGAEKENIKWKFWFRKEYNDLLKRLEQAGVPQEKQEYIPESLEELELFADMGGFKLATEIGIENLITHTDNISNKDEIARRIREDLYVLNVGAIRDFTSTETGMAKYKYVDPARLIVIGGEEDNNYKNASAFGYLTYYTLAELRRETGLDEDEIRDLASTYSGKFNNGSYSSIAGFGAVVLDDKNKFAYDDWVVPVLDCEMLTVDTRYKTKSKNKYGNWIWHDEKFGRVRDSEKRKTKKVDLKVWRRAKWIIGSEIVFDYGLQFDIPRPTPKEANPSFHVYKIPGKSIQEQINPVLSSLQTTWLRYQNLKATGKLSGISIEISSLEAVKIKGKSQSPLELLKMYTQTNVLLYKQTTHRGQFYNPHTNKPVEVLPSGFSQDLAALVGAFKTDIEFIREITGINDIVAATSPNPEVGLGQSKLAIGATSNTLKKMIVAYKEIYESVAKNVSLRLQCLAKGEGSDGIYESIVGKSMWKTIKLGSKRPLVYYGIHTVPKITAQERENIELKLERAIGAGKSGKPIITMGEYFAVQRMLASGISLKMVQVFLANRERSRTEEEDRIQKENMRLNAEHGDKTAEKKKNYEIEVINAKKDADIALKKTEGAEERLTKKDEHGYKMAEIEKQNSTKPKETEKITAEKT